MKNRPKQIDISDLAFFVAFLLLFQSCKETLQIDSVTKQPKLGTKSVKILEVAGLEFRDLNKNDTLDPYEDWRLTAEERSTDSNADQYNAYEK